MQLRAMPLPSRGRIVEVSHVSSNSCTPAINTTSSMVLLKKLLALSVCVPLMATTQAFTLGGCGMRMSQQMVGASTSTVTDARTSTRRDSTPVPAESLLGIPFSRWRWQQSKRVADPGQLEQLLGSLAEAIKAVAGFTRVSAVPDYRQKLDSRLVYQEMGEGRKHNENARRLLEVALCTSGRLGVVAYPGKPPTVIDEGFGQFVATVNPLVGAGGLDAAVPTGTVIGLFDDADKDGCIVDYSIDDEDVQEEMCLLRTLQPSRNLVGAGYAIYGSSCELVIAVKGRGVHGFTLDSHVGEFFLTRPYMKIPKRGNIYSVDESRRDSWAKELREHIDRLRAGEGESGQKYSYRLIGSAVADVHRTLTCGGIWGRPDTDEGNDPYGGDRTGGLTLLGEASPLAFIIEQAGGRAVDGHGRRVLDIRPERIRQKTGLYVGGEDDILELERALGAGASGPRRSL